MNVFTFTGHLGKDCETSATPTGTAVCQFSVAVSSGFGDRQKTTWVRCAVFGKRAEGKLPEHLVKGQKVAISGELTLDEWEKDGAKHSMLKVNVNGLDLIGDRQPSNTAQHDPQQSQPQALQQGGLAPQTEGQQGYQGGRTCSVCNGDDPDCQQCGIPF